MCRVLRTSSSRLVGLGAIIIAGASCAATDDAAGTATAIAINSEVTKAVDAGQMVALHLDDLKAPLNVKGVQIFLSPSKSQKGDNPTANAIYVGSVSFYPPGQTTSFNLDATRAVEKLLASDANAQDAKVVFVADDRSAGGDVSVAKARLQPVVSSRPEPEK